MNSGIYTSGHFQVSEHEIEDVLSRTGLEYKRSGDAQFAVKDCPFCDSAGHPIKNKTDNQWKCYFTRESGAYFCHRCGSKGSFYDYKKNMGLISPIEHVSGKQKKWKLPDQNEVNAFSSVLEVYPDLVKYITEKRGIRLTVAKKYEVGAALYNFQNEQTGKWDIEELCVTFPWIYYTATGKKVIQRIKARSLANKKHMRLDPTGGPWGIFGWHTVPNDAQEIVVTEGEWDAMAVYQETGIPAVSLPNGSRSLPVDLLPWFERFEKIYLWMDDDPAGHDGAIQFAKKFGERRTWIVQSKLGDPNGPKDANDCLLRKEAIMDRLDASQPLPHQEIVTAEDLKDDVFREILSPEQVSGTPYDHLPKLNRILKGHRRGEMRVFTGGTGTGKTTILAQESLALAKRGMRTCWGSFEIKNHRLAKTMLNQLAQKQIAKHPADLPRYWDQFVELPLWFMKFFGATDIDKILDAMDYAQYVHDCENFILDNLQFFTSGKGRGGQKFDYQDEAIQKIRDFCSYKNVNITLVIHPKKITEGYEMDIASLGGTAKASQEADSVIILQKGEWFRYLDVRKNRFDGDLGKIAYEYNRESQCIRELSAEEMQAKRDNPEVESGEEYGTVSQIAKPSVRSRRSDRYRKPKEQKPNEIPNYAQRIDQTAYRNSKGLGASHD